MKVKIAVEILKEYQLWRLGSDKEMLHPKQITEALNIAINELDKKVKVESKIFSGSIPKTNTLKK